MEGLIIITITIKVKVKRAELRYDSCFVLSHEGGSSGGSGGLISHNHSLMLV